jgi:hypothetical protein
MPDHGRHDVAWGELKKWERGGFLFHCEARREGTLTHGESATTHRRFCFVACTRAGPVQAAQRENDVLLPVRLLLLLPMLLLWSRERDSSRQDQKTKRRRAKNEAPALSNPSLVEFEFFLLPHFPQLPPPHTDRRVTHAPP